MSRIKLDPESNIVKEQFAVVYAPTRRDAQVSQETGGRERPRRHRDRFPDTCVQVMDSRAAALAAADPAGKRFAAAVLGPSRSSEGFMLYYLVEWLDENQ
jgi:hypothetical protein